METSKEIKNKERILTLVETIKTLILGELKSIVYQHQGSAFIKFLNIAIAIEYLGACLDHHPFDKDKQSEKRFNEALKELFEKKYKKYTKTDSEIYFFKEFRCSFIHQLRPGSNIVVTHREEAKKEKTTHLVPLKSGPLVLVLEDFYDDLEKAATGLIRKFEKGKITNQKGGKGFIKYVTVVNNE
jgi:hypothetical protein